MDTLIKNTLNQAGEIAWQVKVHATKSHNQLSAVHIG